MLQYQNLLRHILDNGVLKGNRTGTDTFCVFGHQLRFDLSHGFPLVTTKLIHTRSVLYELLWMLNGDSNVKFLNDNGVRIWDDWADPDTGSLGPIYGVQWRSWTGERDPAVGSLRKDQLADIVDKLQTNPEDRRMILNSWNVGRIHEMALPPCHLMAQFDVTQRRLSCHMYMRSWDVFLGGPFNIAQYAFLTHMLAHTAGLEVGDLVLSSGCTHLYTNHLEQAREQLSREPRALPTLSIAERGQDIRSRKHGIPPSSEPVTSQVQDPKSRWLPYQFEDFTLTGYDPHPHIKGTVAV